MPFNSIQFLAFYAIVFLLWLALPKSRRWQVLLLASYGFYASWGITFLPSILLTTLASYSFGLAIGRTQNKRTRGILLALGLSFSLGMLVFFNYYDLLSRLLIRTINLVGVQVSLPQLSLIAPIGISFYTLMVISYLVDVYRGTLAPEKHLGIFALYLAFFPHQVAGPISRAKQLLPQLRQMPAFDRQQVATGFRHFLWGLFLKAVIADRFAYYVDPIFDNPTGYQGVALLVAITLFSIQIFCDFAGYSSMAVGLAKIFGIDLVENFRYPYIAKDAAEFWNRWHISLSTWLRDYIFYPVSRVLRRRWPQREAWVHLLIPPMITMLVSGLWHGAHSNFLIWGGLHGLYLVLAAWTADWRKRVLAKERLGRFVFLADGLQIFMTFSLVSLAWVFFRARTYPDAVYILGNMFVIKDFDMGMETPQLVIALVLVLIMVVVHSLQRAGYNSSWLARQSIYYRWAIYYLTIFAILYLGFFNGREFVYAEF